MRALPTILVLTVSLAGGCSSRAPREEVVTALHRVADGYKHLDPGEILQGYGESFTLQDSLARFAETSATGGITARRGRRELDREGYREILQQELAQYRVVESAKFVLDTIQRVGALYEVDAWFNLYGIKADGRRHHEVSWHRFSFQEKQGELSILKHEVLRREQTESAEPHFRDRTVSVGLGIEHRGHAEIGDSTPIIPGNFSGSGASAGDIDGDGFLDVVVGDGEHSRLFRNLGDGTFADVTEAAGLGEIGSVRGAYFFDFDDDGLLDIFFTRVKKPPVLLQNRGQLRFTALPWQGTTTPAGQGESAAFGDLDGDGDLDIYLVRYGDFDETSWAYPIYDAQDGQRSALYRNDGDGVFVELDAPDATPAGWGLAVAMGDYDDDGDLDLYLVNDFGQNHLLRNDGDFRFVDVTEEAGVADQGLGMSSAFGDYDGDGDLDIYVANMHSSARWVFEDPEFPLPTVADLLMLRPFIQGEMQKVTRGNSLFRNRGDGTFDQVAGALGVERAGWAWGANFFDYDNDGDLDIYCPNGFITGAEADDL